MKPKRFARIQISFELMRQMLHLPDDVKIVRVLASDEKIQEPTLFEIVVTSDVRETIPEVHEGQTIPIVKPVFYQKSVFDRMEI